MADLPVTPLANYGSMITPPESISDVQSASAVRGLTQQQTALAQQQTQAAAIGNQRAHMQMTWAQNMIDALHSGGGGDAAPGADTSGVAPGAADDSGADDTHTSIEKAGLDPSHITSHAQQKYAVPDIWTKDEQANLAIGVAAGVPNATDLAQKLHDIRIGKAKAQAQLGASQAYDDATTVATAPDGTALSTLAHIHPDAASAIEKLAKKNGWDEDQTDQFARTYANDIGNAVHKYSGREIDIGNDKVARDKVTQRPLLGANPAGLSPDEQAKYMQEALKPVTIKEGDHEVQIPQWQYAHAPSAQAYVNRSAMRDRAQNRQEPGVSGGAAQPTAPVAAPGAQTAKAGAKAPAAAAPAITDPVLKAALADTSYDTPLVPTQRGVSAGPAQVEASKHYVAAKNDLLKETSFNAKVGGAALVYLNAAKKVLDAGGVTTGFAADERTTINRMLGYLHLGSLTNDPARNITLTKNLVNAALQNIKATFGPRVTANEVFLNLEKANPSPNMPDNAIRDLVNENAQIAKYEVDTAERAHHYVGNTAIPKKDPTQFEQWNQKYFPREQAVQVTDSAALAAAAKAKQDKNAEPVVLRSKSGRPIWHNPKTGRLEYK